MISKEAAAADWQDSQKETWGQEGGWEGRMNSVKDKMSSGGQQRSAGDSGRSMEMQDTNVWEVVYPKLGMQNLEGTPPRPIEVKTKGMWDHSSERSKDKTEHRRAATQGWVLEAPLCIEGRAWGRGPQEKVDVTVPYLSLKQKGKSALLILPLFNI